LISKIKNGIDKKLITLGIFIDLKKAFDTISHKKLIKKFANIGISGTALKILESYLKNRSQIVKIGQYKSNPQNITFGIPQGSILGSLFFIIYVNNLDNLGLSGHLTLYADDTCLFYSGYSIHDIIVEAQKDLDKLNSWFLHNLLTINVKKTSFIIFKPKNKKIPDFSPLTINNCVISRSYQEKYLGLWLDDELTWRTHIEHIKNKLIPLLGSLQRVSCCIPPRVRNTLYNALVKSNLQYLIEIWGTASKSAMSDLQTLQNKILKVLFHLNFRTPTETLYRKTNLLNIDKLYKYIS
jgi:hypothetical protein